MGKELFKNIPSKVGDLVKDVRNGRIGLPDLQRPFVWKDNKVRELFDSMLKGYPIGYIMLWESPSDYESKKSTIGQNAKTYEEPKELVIDGQQRLTALVAAMFAVKVKDKNFADREIKISYNPLTREFAVWSQAYERDPEWISRISDVFLAKEDNSISSLRRRFIKEANEGRSKKELPLLTDEEEDRIEDNINALLNLSDYSLPTLEISYTADEEALQMACELQLIVFDSSRGCYGTPYRYRSHFALSLEETLLHCGITASKSTEYIQFKSVRNSKE